MSSRSFAAIAFLCVPAAALAQNQIKGRVMVMVDTSGSMVWHFGDCNSANGDGAGSPALFCDNGMGAINGKTFACNQNVACTAANGAAALFPVANVNNPSRLYSAKAALTDVLNSAGGDLDFGLERYAESGLGDYIVGINVCPDASDCSTTQIDGVTRGRDVPRFIGGYPSVPNSVNCDGQIVDQNGNLLASDCNLTWAGACGTSGGCAANCTNTSGGQILIQPGTNSSQTVLPWVDFTEDFCSSNGVVGGPPRNPELRANGITPLAGSIRTARQQWYTPIFTASNGGNCNPNVNPLCDTQINCRPYVNVVMTDGAETCEAGTIAFSDPQTAVQELTNVNNVNPVKTYVLALSFTQTQTCNNNNQCGSNSCVNGSCHCNNNNQCGQTCDGFAFVCSNGVCTHPAFGSLNAMAAAGGTGTARFVNNQQDIEAAFADIVSSSVKVEICNGADDNCNQLIDEGLGVYQECTLANQCASNVCNLGRCTCANNGQCANGFSCGNGFCVPSCSIGVGACLRNGVKKCSGGGATCCVNDGLAACTPLTAGAPMMEVCNGIDDNCNGLIDENGVCQVCTPTPEVCDGMDNDCNGKIDDNLTDTGAACGLNLGICKPGSTVCVNGGGQNVQAGGVPDVNDHLICQGGVQAGAPQCNGCDNDCDGLIDAPTQACYTGPNGTDGVGVCHGGLEKCTANMCPQAPQYGPCVGQVLPSAEICNGLDDDCNGKVDDLPGANMPCCPSGKCGVGVCTAGMEQCSGGTLQCIGGTGPSAEVCNGLDDDCNGKVDDLPTIGQPCVPMGNLCGGTLQCDPQKMMIVCVPNGMGGKEICNGIDDDCDGLIDEEPDIDMNDGRLNQPCGNPNNLPLPCMAGKTICKNGQVVCQGAVGPGMEVCNGKDDDCNGMVDNNAPCPMGFLCYGGQCDPLCNGGEFPCPGGYGPMMVNGQCVCVPDKTCNPACTAPLVCDPQTGMCADPCAKITCPNGLACQSGSCVGCEQLGCAGQCQRCDKASHLCVVDKCCNVQCGQTQFCDPTDGMCVGTCPNGCPTGQVCQDGNCAANPCAGKTCPEGQTCDTRDGTCQPDVCGGVTCVQNLTCCGNACVADPCKVTVCPENTFCHVNTISCQTTCDAVPEGKRDEVVGAGGGGFGCSVGGGRTSSGGLGLLALPLFGLALARRRRR